jgi:hypothetical protein
MEIRTIVDNFTSQVDAMIEAVSTDRARRAIAAAFPGNGVRRRGRPPKGLAPLSGPAARRRRKGPKQLCPVPGCKNSAAPVFGMVCAKHKDMPNAKIKKYREARRARKAKAAA